MGKVSLNNDDINASTASNHIYYRKWEYQSTNPTYCTAYDTTGNCIAWGGGDAVYGYNYYYTSATVNGTVKGSVTNVKVNGVAPIVKGDSTTENDTYSLPSGGEYVSGSHSSGSGSVTSGSSTVYVNGKPLSALGSNVNTHASTSSSIKSPGSTNVYVN